MDAARPVRLLVVEDDAPLLASLRDTLRDALAHAAVFVETVAAGLAQLAAADFEVALVDLMLADGRGIEIVRQIARQGLATEAIVITGDGSVETAIEAMKIGAYGYVTRPPRAEELMLAVRKAAEKARLRRENESLRACLGRLDGEAGVVTEDAAMKEVLAAAERVAASDLPVFIEGEVGTGRELIARTIHRRSSRAERAFVTVDCATAAATLEGELFGSENGGNGHPSRHPGLLEMADGGVLFFDEVCDLAAPLQVKVLRTLETREYARVGSARPLPCDVRVVSAARKDMKAEAREGRFRDDLSLRLSGVALKVPPLRERRGDVPLLARHFLERQASSKTFTPAATEALAAYAWPGNVRELEMVVGRAALVAAGDAIDAGDLPEDVREPSRAPSAGRTASLAEVEREYIESVLRRNGGHRGKTARALGIDPKTLYNKLGPERPRKKP